MIAVRALHHRHLSQAAPERHQVRPSSGRRHRRRRCAPGLQKAAGSAFDISQVHDRRPSDARRPPARPRRGVRADRGSEAARDRDRRSRRRPACRDGGRDAGALGHRGQGAQLAVREVRPLAAGDSIGLGIFMFMIVCTICGYLAADPARDGRPGPVARAPLRDPRGGRRAHTDDRLPDRRPRLRHLHGLVRHDPRLHRRRGALLVRIGLVTRLLQVLIGPPAIFASLAIFVFLNIPSLGATYTARVLAAVLALPQPLLDRRGDGQRRAQHPLLRRAGRLDGHAQAGCLDGRIVALLLLLPVSRKLEREREVEATTVGAMA